MTYRLGSLCSGAGALDMAAAQVLGDMEHAWSAESDPAASKVLAHHWPNVANLGDITAVDWATVQPVDLICAGFPCQPVSQAGKRKVTDDARWLWPHIARAVRVLRPRLVVLENVAGLLIPWHDGPTWQAAPVEEVVGDLAEGGFGIRWCCVRASDIGAPHRRERVFIVAADPHRPRLERQRELHGETGGEKPAARAAPDLRWDRYVGAIERWQRLTRPVPTVIDGQGLHASGFVEWMMGLPAGWVTGHGLSRAAALRLLGNGVVPAQAALALRALNGP